MHAKNPLRDFCPDPSRFDLEWLEPVVEDGVTLRPFRMTTFRLPGGPVRTYGMVGLPEGRGPFPAILHIHGGCQTASRGNLLYNIISWGGFITWLVNGTDGTPKCAVPIYGTGGLSWPQHPDNAAWGKAPDSVRRRWARSLEPAGYACTQRSPVLHLNGANDFFGGFDTAAQMLPSIPTDWRCDYTPNTNHGFDVGSRLAMEAWFDQPASW
jgi:dienelactone hydrolase